MDRENVIRGIDICLQRFHCGEDCPYYDNCDELGCMEQLREDALELLKEQEAHVLTLDEAFDLQEKTPYPCIFVDIKGRNDVFLAYISDEIYGDYHSDDFKVDRPWLGADRIYHKTEYGRLIRFWKLFPTNKQRNEVKW